MATIQFQQITATQQHITTKNNSMATHKNTYKQQQITLNDCNTKKQQQRTTHGTKYSNHNKKQQITANSSTHHKHNTYNK